MDAQEESVFKAVVITGITLGILLGYFIITILRQQRKLRLLYKARIGAQITTLEQERRRVAADLHDGIGPSLTGIRFKLESIDAYNESELPLLEAAREQIGNVFSELRNIANNLVPGSLKNGVNHAIEEFISSMPQNNTQIKFDAQKLPVLPIETATHIYRIVQEIVHNCIRHAFASVLEIELQANKERLLILSTDNGKGFQLQPMLVGRGAGLLNLQSRVDLLDGDMQVKSKPGKGTSIYIEIPVKNNPGTNP